MLDAILTNISCLNSGQYDTVKDTLSKMKKKPESSTVQARKMKILGRYGGPTPFDEQEASEVIDVVLSNMKKFPANYTIQEFGLILLRRTIDGKPNRQSQALAGGALQQVLTSMAAHIKSPGIQAEGCGAIRDLTVAGLVEMGMNLLIRNDTEAAARQKADWGVIQNTVVAEGGVDAILSSMKAHKKNTKVVRQAGPAIRSLLHDNSVSHRYFWNSNGLEIILETLKAHCIVARPRKEKEFPAPELSRIQFAQEVQDSMLTALDAITAGGLSFLSASQTASISTHVFEAIKASSPPNPKHVRVQANGYRILWKLAANSSEDSDAAINAGGVELVVKSIHDFADNSFLLGGANGALACWCSNSEEARRRFDACSDSEEIRRIIAQTAQVGIARAFMVG
eukprot:gnl/MRDRNA2_/MRDRNA2_30373_c0_seq1.p1 gnl/MRDRNA2_/MRDRNA2_30373_c0~~gnl/MRDRNA2_/MRDRNA2_30373_c0_seq1.p1  ORF type:complete len:414 (-),score=61.00 gnl/MRDRNA2_/MRDRNA2_30373_c0_seq1:307-1497(-)